MELPYATKLRGGNDAVITHYFESYDRPFVGFYLDVVNGQDGVLIPCTWLHNGHYLNAQTNRGLDVLLPETVTAA